MTFIRWSRYAFATATLLTTALPAVAQSNLSDVTGLNVSDITGPNVSDITGPNVSDITGPNVSDITGPNVSDITGTNTTSLPLSQSEVHQLAQDIRAAYDFCLSTNDCSSFFSLYDQANAVTGG